MIGFLTVITLAGVFIFALAIFGKAPPSLLTVAGEARHKRPVDRWATLLGNAAEARKGSLSPYQPDSFGWFAGSPVESLEFSRQLSSLQSALQPATRSAQAIAEEPLSVGAG